MSNGSGPKRPPVASCPVTASYRGSLHLFEITELESVAALVRGSVPPTPLYAWPKLQKRAGCSVYVKHENHTPTGAFKVRGGIVYLDRLCRAQPNIPGVISATRGNHGQSIAFAAARAGIPATIYVPTNNSPDQNSAIAAFGARVMEFGRDFDEAKHEAFRVAAAEGLHFVPSFHKDLVVGVATYALELFRSRRKLDAVYVGVGMGSGICGLIAVRDLLGLSTEIVGRGLGQRAGERAVVCRRTGCERAVRADFRRRSGHAGAQCTGRCHRVPRRVALRASQRGCDRRNHADLFR